MSAAFSMPFNINAMLAITKVFFCLIGFLLHRQFVSLLSEGVSMSTGLFGKNYNNFRPARPLPIYFLLSVLNFIFSIML